MCKRDATRGSGKEEGGRRGDASGESSNNGALAGGQELIGAMSIKRFCKRYRISRSHYYQMRRDGIGPKVMQLGRRAVISYAAAKKWQEEQEG